MSATRKCLLSLALMLATVIGGTAPAAAQVERGIWLMLDTKIPWTLTVINLTDYTLLMPTNAVQVSSSSASWQSPPFMSWPYNLVNLESYRSMTWKSNLGSSFGGTYWTGMMSFVPQGMDSNIWAVNLFFTPEKFNGYWGTWVDMTLNYVAPYWPDNPYSGNDLACYGVNNTSFNTRYNILAVYGTDLAVALYAPYITDKTTTGITLVFRQRRPHTVIHYNENTHYNVYEDWLVAPGSGVCYQDNNATFM